jgi:hypothetical protein
VPEEVIDERVASSFKQWGKPTDATFRFLEVGSRSDDAQRTELLSEPRSVTAAIPHRFLEVL